MLTLAQQFNELATKLMPHMDELIVSEELDTASAIDDVLFRRSEYLGGMAAVILELLHTEVAV